MTTLTLHNVPDHIYERLEIAAKANKRSTSDEAIALLETVLLPTRMTTSERLARAQAFRDTLPAGLFTPFDIEMAKRDGHP